jgi:hypothetical protein
VHAPVFNLFRTFTATHPHIMNAGTQRTLLRWIHILFGLPVIGYIYGPAEEVAQYASMFRYVFMPVILLSGLWMWKGHLLARLFSKKSG